MNTNSTKMKSDRNEEENKQKEIRILVEDDTPYNRSSNQTRNHDDNDNNDINQIRYGLGNSTSSTDATVSRLNRGLDKVLINSNSIDQSQFSVDVIELLETGDGAESTREDVGVYQYDVFFSHAAEDRLWVLKQIELLEGEPFKLKCCFADRDFHLGKPVISNIYRAIMNSRRTVIVLSPEFLTSSWCDYETRITLEAHIDARRNLIIPIMLRPCKVPYYLARLTYIDVQNENYWSRLTSAILDKDTEADYNFENTQTLANVPFIRNLSKICSVLIDRPCCFKPDDLHYPPQELIACIRYADFEKIVKLFRDTCFIKHQYFYSISFIIFLFTMFVPFFLLILFLCRILMHYLHGTSNDNSFIVTLIISILVYFLIVIFRLYCSFKQSRIIKDRLKESNKLAMSKNLIISFNNSSDLDQISLIFYAYDWRMCLAVFKEYTLETRKKFRLMTTTSTEPTASESLLIRNNNNKLIDLMLNVEEKINNEELLSILMEFVPRYTDMISEKLLELVEEERHVIGRECLCQFAERYYELEIECMQSGKADQKLEKIRKNIMSRYV